MPPNEIWKPVQLIADDQHAFTFQLPKKETAIIKKNDISEDLIERVRQRAATDQPIYVKKQQGKYFLRDLQPEFSVKMNDGPWQALKIIDCSCKGVPEDPQDDPSLVKVRRYAGEAEPEGTMTFSKRQLSQDMLDTIRDTSKNDRFARIYFDTKGALHIDAIPQKTSVVWKDESGKISVGIQDSSGRGVLPQLDRSQKAGALSIIEIAPDHSIDIRIARHEKEVEEFFKVVVNAAGASRSLCKCDKLPVAA